MENARTAYEAYRKFCDGKSMITGEKLPPFDDLSECVKAAWKAAAFAVFERIITELGKQD